MPLVPGQWMYVGEQHIRVRDAEMHQGEVLLPAVDGRFRAPSMSSVRTDAEYFPDEDALRSLRLVGDRLAILETDTWSEWIRETPLLPTLNDTLDETPLERQVAANIGYLEAACDRPRTHLRTDEERILVSLCKRSSSRASEVLAAHSEDWDRRTLWGVRPRRILGLVREELFDIYENRVAVALVDHLDAALLRRIRAVRRIVQLLRQREDYQHILEKSANYRRARRILELWSEALAHTGQLAHAEAVERRLLIIRRRILALKNTRLYRHIGGVHSAGLQLRMTNVLIYDDTYRKVADLWVAWEQHIRSSAADPGVQWQQDQAAAAGFDRFVFLLVVRALDSLGFRPVESNRETPLGNRARWDLEGATGLLTIERNALGVEVRSSFAATPLRIVGLPAMLRGSPSVGLWMDSLPSGERLVIASLSPDRVAAPPEVQRRLLHCAYDAEEKHPVFVEVAPWDLESVERVARTLRQYAWSALFGEYPFRAELPADSSLPPAFPGWVRVADRTLRVVRPPAAYDPSWRGLEHRAMQAAAVLMEARRRLEECDPRDSRKRLRLKHELDIAQSQVESVDQLVEFTRRATENTRLLLICPICETRADVDAFEQTDDFFRCRCEECNSEWGRRSCHSCGQAFPYLAFDGNQPSDNLTEADRRYGSDVLALPVAVDVYLCPRCGGRSDGRKVGVDAPDGVTAL